MIRKYGRIGGWILLAYSIRNIWMANLVGEVDTFWIAAIVAPMVAGIVLLVKSWSAERKAEREAREEKKESDEEWFRREFGTVLKERNKESDKGKDIGK